MRIGLLLTITLAAAVSLPVSAEDLKPQQESAPPECHSGSIDFERSPHVASIEVNYPKSESNELGEGWVEVAFTLNANATPDKIEVIDAVGSPIYAQAVQDAVRLAKFEPAISGGKPVDFNGMTFEALFSIEGHNRAGVHYHGFMRAEDIAQRRRNAKKYDEAVATVVDAMTEELNMYELSTLSHGVTYAYLGLNDPQHALVAIRHAALQQGDFLAKDARPHAQALLAQLEAQNNNPQQALCAFALLQQKFPSFPPDADLLRLIGAARAQLTGSDPVRTEIELVEVNRGEVPIRWRHDLIRRSFSFEGAPQSGSAKFRLVCPKRIQEDVVVNGRIWPVDPSGGSCTLNFYGDVGTKFTLVEK